MFYLVNLANSRLQALGETCFERAPARDEERDEKMRRRYAETCMPDSWSRSRRVFIKARIIAGAETLRL